MANYSTRGSGAAKLVALPIKSNREDHTLLTGMQRGIIVFVRSISLEAVGLGIHLAAGAHNTLLQREYILSSIPPPATSFRRSRSKTNVGSNRPMGQLLFNLFMRLILALGIKILKQSTSVFKYFHL